MGRRTARRDDFVIEGTPPRWWEADLATRVRFPIRGEAQIPRPTIGSRSTVPGRFLISRVCCAVCPSQQLVCDRIDQARRGTGDKCTTWDWENAQLRKGARVVLAIGEVKRDASGNVFVGPRFRPA